MAAAEGFEQIDLETVDILDAGLFADGPPHELFARMRKEAPVRWNRTADGGGFWSVTRREDVAAISRDPETFSSSEAGIFVHPDQVFPLDLTRNLLLYKDPPDHTKYRRILQTAFVPNTIGKREGDVRRRVSDAIDAVIEAGSCDFVTDIAVPVPLRVLMDLMGLPDEDMPQLYRWTEEIEQAQLSPEPGAALPTLAEEGVYLDEQIKRQTETAKDSLVTQLRAAEVDGERLSDEEILLFFGLLGFAGNDTTRNTASSGMLALLTHPDQWKLLCEEPERIPNAVEEVLRFTSVVQYFCRTATVDTELGGERIGAGEKVMIWYTSGSRDDAVEQPQRFDVTREAPDHMAFGGGGRHFCLGAGLARLELRVLLEELARRMPSLALDGPVERLSSAWANSLTSMPVRFEPGAREA